MPAAGRDASDADQRDPDGRAPRAAADVDVDDEDWLDVLDDEARPTSRDDALAAGRRDADAALAGEPAANRAGTADQGPRPESREPAADTGAPGCAGPLDFSGRPIGWDPSDDSDGLSEEFGEPDADDPADEPPPQAVRPSDAVRVAQMDAEVQVVDGRPRYHMADCSHLVGRLTEPLPACEAVELGFSPCGLCRPVDRLVAEAARR